MPSESLLQSIRRWLLVIALFASIRVYYLAENGYADPAPDGPDAFVALFAVACGVVTALALVASVIRWLRSTTG